MSHTRTTISGGDISTTVRSIAWLYGLDLDSGSNDTESKYGVQSRLILDFGNDVYFAATSWSFTRSNMSSVSTTKVLLRIFN